MGTSVDIFPASLGGYFGLFDGKRYFILPESRSTAIPTHSMKFRGCPGKTCHRGRFLGTIPDYGINCDRKKIGSMIFHSLTPTIHATAFVVLRRFHF